MFLLFKSNFVSYGAEHLSWIIAGVASALFWIILGMKQTSLENKRRVGLAMSMIPVVLWVSISIYIVLHVRPVDLGLVLPFHVCYFLNMLMPVMMWRQSYSLFEVSYFMVMAGSLQALLTPDLQTVFPDYMNIRYFFIHIGLPQSILFAIFVYGFRPTWSSLGKAFMWMNVYLVFVSVVNLTLGTNFMYVCRKPNAPTLLDIFGDWPWYLIGGELLALVLFTVVMMPFAVRWPTLRRERW